MLGCWDVGLTLKVESRDQHLGNPGKTKSPPPKPPHEAGETGRTPPGRTAKQALRAWQTLVSLKPPSPGAAQLQNS